MIHAPKSSCVTHYPLVDNSKVDAYGNNSVRFLFTDPMAMKSVMKIPSG